MFIRLVKRAEARADEILKQRQAERVEEASGLIRTLQNIALAYTSNGTTDERLKAIGSLLGPDMVQLIERCEEHAALMSGNGIRLLPLLLRPLRSALLLLLEHLPLESTTQDDSVRRAITFMLAHKNSRSELLPITIENSNSESATQMLDLSFVADNWWPLVTRTKNRKVTPTHVDRQFFEACTLAQIAADLKVMISVFRWARNSAITASGWCPGRPTAPSPPHIASE
jgi:hypothetical protein